MFRKTIAFFVSFCFIFEQASFAQLPGTLDLSGSLASRSQPAESGLRPAQLRYLAYESGQNRFSLSLDTGKTNDPEDARLEENAAELFRYFLIGVSLPDDVFWVNLRPDAPDDVIDPRLEKTDVGRILLEADLQLKKDTALATSPQSSQGKEYWDRMYKKAEELFGSRDTVFPTLTRPWIVPDEIILRESSGNAYIYKATLKVLLEEDYLKATAGYDFKDPRQKELNSYASALMRELILPQLVKQVNTSARYLALRQVYHSLILAQWFKRDFRASPGEYPALIDSERLDGLVSAVPWQKKDYFDRYKASFEKGEYRLSLRQGDTIRQYSAGGVSLGNLIGKASAVINKLKAPVPGSGTGKVTGQGTSLASAVKFFRSADQAPGGKTLTGEDPEEVRTRTAASGCVDPVLGQPMVDLEHFVACQNKLAEKLLSAQTLAALCKALGISDTIDDRTYDRVYAALARGKYSKETVDLINNGAYQDPRLVKEISRQNQDPRLQSIFEALDNSYDAHIAMLAVAGATIGQFGKGVKQILSWLEPFGTDTVTVVTRKGSGPAYRKVIRQGKLGQDYISLQEITPEEFKEYTARYAGEALEHGTVVRGETARAIPLLESELDQERRISQEGIINGILTRYPYVGDVDIYTRRGDESQFAKVNGFGEKVVVVPEGQAALSGAQGRFAKVAIDAHSFTIADNGIGMDAGIFSRMFVPREGDKHPEPLSGEKAQEEARSRTKLVHDKNLPHRVSFSRNGQVLITVDIPEDIVAQAAVPGGLQVELARLMEVGEQRDSDAVSIPLVLKEDEESNFELGVRRLVNGVIRHSTLTDTQKLGYINTIAIGLDGLKRENDNYKFAIDKMLGRIELDCAPLVSSLRQKGTLIVPHNREYGNLVAPEGRSVLYLHPMLFDWNEYDVWSGTLTAMGAFIVPRNVLVMGGEKKLTLVIAPYTQESMALNRGFRRGWESQDQKTLRPVITSDRYVIVPEQRARVMLRLLKKQPSGLTPEEETKLKAELERANIVTGEEVSTGYAVNAEKPNMKLVVKQAAQDTGQFDSPAINGFLVTLPSFAGLRRSVAGKADTAAAFLADIDMSLAKMLKSGELSAGALAQIAIATWLSNDSLSQTDKQLPDSWRTDEMEQQEKDKFFSLLIASATKKEFGDAMHWPENVSDKQMLSNALVDLVRSLLAEREYEKVRELLVTGKGPSQLLPRQRVVALCDFGVALAKEGNKEEGQKLIVLASQSAMVLGNDMLPYLGYCAAALIRMGETDLSAGLLERLYVFAKNFKQQGGDEFGLAWVHWQISLAMSQAGYFTEAVDIARKCGELKSSALSHCVIRMAEAGKIDEALRLVSEIDETASKIYAFCALARQYVKQGNTAQARELLEKVIGCRDPTYLSQDNTARFMNKARKGPWKTSTRISTSLSFGSVGQMDTVLNPPDTFMSVYGSEKNYGLLSPAEEAVDRAGLSVEICRSLAEAGMDTKARELAGSIFHKPMQALAFAVIAKAMLSRGKVEAARADFKSAQSKVIGTFVPGYLIVIDALAEAGDPEFVAGLFKEILAYVDKQEGAANRATIICAMARALARMESTAPKSEAQANLTAEANRAVALAWMIPDAYSRGIALAVAARILGRSGRQVDGRALCAAALQIADGLNQTFKDEIYARVIPALFDNDDADEALWIAEHISDNFEHFDRSQTCAAIYKALVSGEREAVSMDIAHELRKHIDFPGVLKDLGVYLAETGHIGENNWVLEKLAGSTLALDVRLAIAKEYARQENLKESEAVLQSVLVEADMSADQSYKAFVRISVARARLEIGLGRDIETGFAQNAISLLNQVIISAETGEIARDAALIKFMAGFFGVDKDASEQAIAVLEHNYPEQVDISTFAGWLAASWKVTDKQEALDKYILYARLVSEQFSQTSIPAAYASIGATEKAFSFCAGIKADVERDLAYLELAKALAKAGDIDNARKAVEGISSGDDLKQLEAAGPLVEAMAKQGKTKEAQELVKHWLTYCDGDNVSGGLVVTTLELFARYLDKASKTETAEKAGTGSTAGTGKTAVRPQETRAQMVSFIPARSLAGSLEKPTARLVALIALGKELYRAGERKEADWLLDAAQSLLLSIEPSEQEHMTSLLAGLLAESGKWEEAVKLAMTVKDGLHRDTALLAIARSWYAAGYQQKAIDLARGIAHDDILAEYCAFLIEQGRLDEADSARSRIKEPEAWSEATLSLFKAYQRTMELQKQDALIGQLQGYSKMLQPEARCLLMSRFARALLQTGPADNLTAESALTVLDDAIATFSAEPSLRPGMLQAMAEASEVMLMVGVLYDRDKSITAAKRLLGIAKHDIDLAGFADILAASSVKDKSAKLERFALEGGKAHPEGFTLAALPAAYIRIGDFESAAKASGTLAPGPEQDTALMTLIKELAVKDPDTADRLLKEKMSGKNRIPFILSAGAVAKAMAKAGRLTEANVLLEQMVKAALSASQYERGRLAEFIIETCGEVARTKQAGQAAGAQQQPGFEKINALIDSVQNSENWLDLVVELSRVLWRSGAKAEAQKGFDLAKQRILSGKADSGFLQKMVDAELDQDMVEEAKKLARSGSDAYTRSNLFLTIFKFLTRRDWGKENLEILKEISDDNAGVALVVFLMETAVKYPANRDEIAEQARLQATLIKDPHRRLEAKLRIAEELARTGEAGESGNEFNMILRDIDEHFEESQKAVGVLAVAKSLLGIGLTSQVNGLLEQAISMAIKNRDFGTLEDIFVMKSVLGCLLDDASIKRDTKGHFTFEDSHLPLDVFTHALVVSGLSDRDKAERLDGFIAFAKDTGARIDASEIPFAYLAIGNTKAALKAWAEIEDAAVRQATYARLVKVMSDEGKVELALSTAELLQEPAGENAVSDYIAAYAAICEALARAGRIAEAQEKLDMLVKKASTLTGEIRKFEAIKQLIACQGAIVENQSKTPALPREADEEQTKALVDAWNNRVMPARERFITQARAAYLPFLQMLPGDLKQDAEAAVAPFIAELYQRQEAEVLDRLRQSLEGGTMRLDDNTLPLDTFSARMQKVQEALQRYMPGFKEQMKRESYAVQADSYASLFKNIFALVMESGTQLDGLDDELFEAASYGWQVAGLEQKARAAQVTRLARGIQKAGNGKAEKETLRHIVAFLDFFVSRDPVTNARIVSKQISRLMALRPAARDKFLKELAASAKDMDLRVILDYLRNPGEGKDLKEMRAFVVYLTNEVEQVPEKERFVPGGEGWKLPEGGIWASQVIKLEEQRKKSGPDDIIMSMDYLKEHLNSLPPVSEPLEQANLRDTAWQSEEGAAAREFKQNADDATRGLPNPEVTVRYYLQTGPDGKPEFVEEFSDDGTGALEETALIASVSTKAKGSSSKDGQSGFFGTGNLTYFAGVDRVETITRNDKRAYMITRPVTRDEKGNATDMPVTDIREVTDPAVRRGVTVRRITSLENTVPELAQMMRKRDWKVFAGLSQETGARIYFIDAEGNRQPLVVEHGVLSEADFTVPAVGTGAMTGFGKFRILSCKDMPLQVVEKNGRRVRGLDIDSEYFELVPQSLRRFARELGIVIQVPMEKLTRSRSAFEEEKYYLQFIKRYVAIEFYKAMAYKTMTQASPQFAFGSFPADWQSNTNDEYWKENDPLKDEQITSLANLINAGKYNEVTDQQLRWLMPAAGVIDKEKRFERLVTLLLVPDASGKKTSLFGSRIKVQDVVDPQSAARARRQLKAAGMDESAIPDAAQIPDYQAWVSQGSMVQGAYEQMRHVEDYVIDPGQYTEAEQVLVREAKASAGEFGLKQVILVSNAVSFAGCFREYDDNPTMFLKRSLARKMGVAEGINVDSGTNTIIHELAHWLEKLMKTTEKEGILLKTGSVASASGFTHDATGMFGNSMQQVAWLTWGKEEGDGGIEEAQKILSGHPDIVAKSVENIFGRKDEGLRVTGITPLGEGAYRKTFRVVVSAGEQALAFVLKVMDREGQDNLSADIGSDWFLIEPAGGFAAAKGVKVRVDDAVVETQEELDPIRFSQVPKEKQLETITQTVQAYLECAGLKQWPPASAEGVIFPVDVSFSNAGFTRSGQSRVKVFDMDLARRCTPLQVIEMLSYLSTVIDRPHFGETAVLEGMRQAMGEQSLRAFLRAAAQELKGLRESGRTVEGEDELYMSRGAGRTFESTYLPNGFVAILKEYESDGGHKSVPAQSNQAPGAGHEPVPALPQAPGGIDLRQLPLPGDLSAPRFAPLSSQTLERIDTMDGAREWNRIRSMLDAGMLPSTESLRVYLIRCCKDNALAQRLDAILCCMADILQAEEERGYATDPQTKLILALLESEKDCQEIGRLLRSSP